LVIAKNIKRHFLPVEKQINERLVKKNDEYKKNFPTLVKILNDFFAISAVDDFVFPNNFSSTAAA
jgi:hypothetical protein